MKRKAKLFAAVLGGMFASQVWMAGPAFADTTSTQASQSTSQGPQSSTQASQTSSQVSHSTPQTSQSTSQASQSTAALNWTSGIVVSNAIESGQQAEVWAQNTSVIGMNSLKHSDDSNQLALSGQVADGYAGDIIVDIVSHVSAQNNQPTTWAYSLPVTNGTFSATVVIPFHGRNDVYVGLPNTSGSNLGIQAGYASLHVQNNQSTLSSQDMALLQSWAVNYNESPSIQKLAKQLTSATTAKYDMMRRVSDWVSGHVAYNWDTLKRGQVVWQQADSIVQNRTGVCQDESFLTAALLRSVGVPTQVVAGEGVSNGGTVAHEWVKAWDGSRWVTFDPTWDQVYSQTSAVSLPKKVDHAYFDAPRQVFTKSHKNEQVDTW